MADSSQTNLAYVAESTYGTTPATPTLKNVRFTGEALNANFSTVQSNEIRADRNVQDLTRVAQSAGGSVDFELSYGSFDDWLAAVMFGAWSSNVLVNGVTQSSFTLEKLFETGATDQYHRLTGAIPDSLSLSMAVNQIVTGSFGFVAKGFSSAQTAITGSSYTAVNSNPVINASNNFASLAMTGVTSPELTALDINIANNLAQQAVLGSVEARGIRKGQFVVTGTLSAYFENEELLEMYLDGTATDLTFKLGGASSKNYVFNIPNLKFQNGRVVAGGNNQDVLAQMEFTGLYDSGIDGTLEITRTA